MSAVRRCTLTRSNEKGCNELLTLPMIDAVEIRMVYELVDQIQIRQSSIPKFVGGLG
jgi:hypothetical protein